MDLRVSAVLDKEMHYRFDARDPRSQAYAKSFNFNPEVNSLKIPLSQLSNLNMPSEGTIAALALMAFLMGLHIWFNDQEERDAQLRAEEQEQARMQARGQGDQCQSE